MMATTTVPGRTSPWARPGTRTSTTTTSRRPLTATIPSHDYVFFDNAAVGQRLHQLLAAVTLAHQFEFSNLYYKLGYGYAFSEQVLGEDTGYQRFDGELGYFRQRTLVRARVRHRPHRQWLVGV